jgi:hypothetical protein
MDTNALEGIGCLWFQDGKVGHGERMVCNIRTGIRAKSDMSQAKLKLSLYSLDRSLGLQAVDATRKLDRLRKKMARLSALCTSHLYPPGDILGTHFC